MKDPGTLTGQPVASDSSHESLPENQNVLSHPKKLIETLGMYSTLKIQ